MKPRLTPRPKPIDANLYASQIVHMYVNEGMSVMRIAKTIRETLPKTQCINSQLITQVLTNAHVVRTHSQNMKVIVQHLSYDKSCRSCRQQFQAKRYNHNYCSICAPDETSLGRVMHFGVTHEHVEKMLNEQHNRCALCEKDFDLIIPRKRKKTAISVDHDHTTGRVRGLLCDNCNVSLGHLENKGIKWLDRALVYIGRASV